MNSTSSTSLKPWQFFLTASFLGAAAAVWLAPPAESVALVVMSLAIFAAGGCAVALHALIVAVSGRSAPETIVTGSVRESLEREKLLTLRTLKDLEFDKAMGKVSAADAAPMEARLRERAMVIMRDLDSRAAVRARIEADLAQRPAQDSGPRAQDLNLAAGARRPDSVVCASCATTNDVDARFCKGCGAKL